MRLQLVKEVAAVHLYCVAKMTHGDGLNHNLHRDCTAKKKKKKNNETVKRDDTLVSVCVKS